MTPRPLAGLESEPVPLIVPEHRPPSEALLDRRLRELDAAGAEFLVGPGQVVAVEEDVRVRELFWAVRWVALPEGEHEDRVFVRRLDLEPTLLAVPRVVYHVELHRPGPKAQRPILILDLDDQFLHTLDHVSALLPRVWCFNAGFGSARTPEVRGATKGRRARGSRLTLGFARFRGFVSARISCRAESS